MTPQSPTTLTLDRRLIEHPQALHLRRIRAGIWLYLGTGLRWGELTRVTTSDVQDGVLLVHQTKSTKMRRVPLPPDLLDELKNRVGKLNPPARGAATPSAQRAPTDVTDPIPDPCGSLLMTVWTMDRSPCMVQRPLEAAGPTPSRSPPATTPLGTLSRRTCSRMATTSRRFRNSSATAM